jgi:hypothetical protein
MINHPFSSTADIATSRSPPTCPEHAWSEIIRFDLADGRKRPRARKATSKRL